MDASPSYPAVILAGGSGTPEADDPVAAAPNKALLPVAGLPMLTHVAQALARSGLVESLWVVGLEEEELPASLPHLPLHTLPDSGSLIGNALAGIRAAGSEAEYVLCASSDVPLLTPEAVRDFVTRARESDGDFCYAIVRREVLEARFPGSGRRYRRLAEGAFAGGDIYLVRPELARARADFLTALTENRKHLWRLLLAMGPSIFVRYALGRLRIAHLERRASHVLGLRCRAIVSPHAEVAMDVDDARQLALAEATLTRA